MAANQTARKSNGCRWAIPPLSPAVEDLARQLRTHRLVAQVMHNRGLADPGAARGFLSPKFSDLHDPADLPGAAEAADRLAAAIRDGRPIAIYGDYDVDGMTGLAILALTAILLGVLVPLLPEIADFKAFLGLLLVFICCITLPHTLVMRWIRPPR